MKLPFAEPVPSGSERAEKARQYRELAAQVSRQSPQAVTRGNCEENDYGEKFPANFTKGLAHDKCGLLENPEDYACFVQAINSTDEGLFDKQVKSARDRGVEFSCSKKKTCKGTERVEWRGWESPRAGHIYDLEGPDAGAVAMAPAPRVGSSELAAEIAEVYSLAILRDVPFTVQCEGGAQKLCEDKEGKAKLSAEKVVSLLNEMPFYSGASVCSSTPGNTNAAGYNGFEANRRFARTQSIDGPLTTENVFRGSTPGALVGPYISQFLLIGGDSQACSTENASDFPGVNAQFGYQDGFIPYGAQSIDQRTLSHKNCLDYMTDWSSWLDVQNGANFIGADQFEGTRRYITTPRDLATYVHYDALYQAYLNACLIMFNLGVPFSRGFAEPSLLGQRTAFASYGPPHILSLVTEVATRCLKAVRRQKFNYHRRARPEALSGRLTLANLEIAKKLGCSEEAFKKTLDEIPETLKEAVIKHNHHQNKMEGMRNLKCSDPCYPEHLKKKQFEQGNLLLPMAFPEGSPMHPSYGAGHATVAGGCVTMLKAFFEMFEDCHSGIERKLCDSGGNAIVRVPNQKGTRLKQDKKFKGKLSIQGELDKLAANIAIGRNMAGVHFYSDYYDSLRMGERIAVGILLEQSISYGDRYESSFTSFDGDHVIISGKTGSAPELTISDKQGRPVATQDWWLRHTSGDSLVLNR